MQIPANQTGLSRTIQRHIASASAATMIAILILTSSPGLYVRAAQKPDTVSGFGVQVSSSPTATLTWNKVDCDGYKVCRDKRVIARVKPGTSGSQVTFVDENIDPGKSYTYSVKAYRNENGKEICSSPATPLKIVDGYTYSDAGDGGIKLTGYTGQDTKLVIPDTLDGKKVTGIGDGCFSGNPWPERVYVPEGVVKIGDYGFECCSHIEKIYLPDSLREIGNGAFSGCGVLTLADFSDGVTSIGDGAFMACQSMTRIALPADLQQLGKFAFAFCNDLTDVSFRGNKLTAIPERAFDSCSNLEVIDLPNSVTTIGKRAFYNCDILRRINGNALKEVGDYAFERTEVYDISGALDDDVTLGFGVFARNETDRYNKDSFSGDEKQTDLPGTATLTEGVFYGSPINGIRMYSSDHDNYKVIDGSVYTADGKTLFVYFPTELNENYEYEKTSEAEQKIFHVPEGVTRIAPYAFFECGLEQIYLPSTLTEISDHAFTRSGIAPDPGMLTDYDGNEITAETEGITFGSNAFDKWSLDPEVPAESTKVAITAAGGAADNSGTAVNGPFPDSYTMTSLAGDKSLYRAEDFDGYSDITDRFSEWCREYIEKNKSIMPFDMQMKLLVAMYCSMYKSDQHYNQMAVALNGDTDWAPEALRISGHEYEDMYLMADHGVSTELHRAQVHDDLVLYSGITDAFVNRIAGATPGTQVTADDLIAAIGSEYEEKAMMSTSASFKVSYGFTGDYGVMAIILASDDALNSLGTFCLDCFKGSDGNNGELELLLDAGARFKVLDVGTAEAEVWGQPGKCTYVMMELLEDEKDPFELTDEECKCDNEEDEDEPDKEDTDPDKEDNEPEKEDVEPEKEDNEPEKEDSKPKKDESGTKYKKGWVKTKEGWKYRKSDGSFATGWLKLGDRWFYLNSDGIMQTGWQVIDGERYYMNSEGVMLTGWHEIDGIWYYFSESGALRK